MKEFMLDKSIIRRIIPMSLFFVTLSSILFFSKDINSPGLLLRALMALIHNSIPEADRELTAMAIHCVQVGAKMLSAFAIGFLVWIAARRYSEENWNT
jgi:hypothetical protein